MHALTRLLFSLVLSLALATTSVTGAVMRSEMQGVTDLVICSNGPDGTELVSLDPLGNPVSAGHHCADCLAAHQLAMLVPFEPPVQPQAAAAVLAPPRIVPGNGLACPTARARDPPGFA